MSDLLMRFSLTKGLSRCASRGEQEAFGKQAVLLSLPNGVKHHLRRLFCTPLL
jgi:hypothetical protein